MSPFVFPEFPSGSEAHSLLSSVSAFLSAPELADRAGRGWLVACSGGADSVALLLAVVHVSVSAGAEGPGGVRVEVACVDHGLREAAAGDVVFVSELAARLGVPFHTARLATTRDHVGESQLRDARYELFTRWQRERGLGGVLLGHTMEDQAETLLLHLIRGTGPRGLSGMRAIDGDRVRPLLSWSKSQLQAFLGACGVIWREDETNAGDRYLRNRVRHGLLEAMARENPRIVEALSRTAGLVALEHDAIVELAERELATRTVRLPGALESWPLERLLRWPPGVRAILLRRWWRDLSPEHGELRATAVLDALAALDQTGEGAWDWPGPVRLVAHRGLLVMSRPAEAARVLATVTWDDSGTGLPSGSQLRRPQKGAGFSLRFVRPGDRLLRPDGTAVRCKKLLEEVPRGLRPFALALVDGQDRVVSLQFAPPSDGALCVRLWAGTLEIPAVV